MKTYIVTYYRKMNNRETEFKFAVEANNAREACKICKRKVNEQTGHNAFRPVARRAD